MRNRTYAWVRDHRKCVDKIIRLNAELKLLTEIEVKKARREGWEQAKAEAVLLSESSSCDSTIAAMEYVEKTNER